MRKISLDGGFSFKTASQAIAEIRRRNMWEVVASYMDDSVREDVHIDLAPCAEQVFLHEYLKRARTDLVIG